MKRFCFFFVVIALALVVRAADKDTSVLLEELDRTIAEGRKYMVIRQAEISGMKSKLKHAATDEERYELMGKLREAYGRLILIQRCTFRLRNWRWPSAWGGATI